MSKKSETKLYSSKEEREFMESLKRAKPVSRFKLAFYTLMASLVLGACFAGLQWLCLLIGEGFLVALAFWFGVSLILGSAIVAFTLVATGSVMRDLHGSKP